MFATTTEAQHRLKQQFRQREPERIYLAVVYGHPSPASGVWNDHLVWDQKVLVQKETHPKDPHGKEARARYRIVERLRDASLIEVSLVTGRRNQIRLQARLHGHTLVGERVTRWADTLRLTHLRVRPCMPTAWFSSSDTDKPVTLKHRYLLI